jgi:hypothetical protein
MTDEAGERARELKPHGTVAAARRHQRAGEPLCPPCQVAWSEHQHATYEKRKARKAEEHERMSYGWAKDAEAGARSARPMAEPATDDATTLARARELARRIPKDLAVIEVITPDGRDLADDVIELLELLEDT